MAATTENFKISEHVESTTLGEGCIIIDKKNSRYLSVNSAGSRVWELLATGCGSVEKIVTSLRDEYEAQLSWPFLRSLD